MMKRIDIIKELEVLESRKIVLENLKKDIENFYCDEVRIIANMNTKDFNKKYQGESFEVNKIEFGFYIDKEIQMISDKIEAYIDRLQSGEGK
jgi:hypothetical protein